MFAGHALPIACNIIGNTASSHTSSTVSVPIDDIDLDNAL